MPPGMLPTELTGTGVVIEPTRFQPFSTGIVSTGTGKPAIRLLPAAGNLSQYPQPLASVSAFA